MPCSDHTAGSAHPFASSEWWMLPHAAPWQSSVRDKIEHAATQQFITAALEEECSTAFTDNVDLLRLAFRARRDPSVATPRARVGELRGSVAVDAPPAARLFMPLDLLPPPPFRRRETCPTSKGAMEDRWLSVNPISTTPRRSAREVRVTAPRRVDAAARRGSLETRSPASTRRRCMVRAVMARRLATTAFFAESVSGPSAIASRTRSTMPASGVMRRISAEG